MTTRVLYRTAAILILLFDIAHWAGFSWSDPKTSGRLITA